MIYAIPYEPRLHWGEGPACRAVGRPPGKQSSRAAVVRPGIGRRRLAEGTAAAVQLPPLSP